ncbi:hypothetical protein VNO78_12321 [Psophocarpus tetragonolobus]|uniref:Cation/H+ exchanger domain-containing protein n=1 Tax=Psophocarpus tetragonolobus TaxID=3891 RepID=A0AAN9SNR5_PSOTE
MMNSNETIFSSATLLFEIPLVRRQIYNVCISQPMKIISDGIWTPNEGSKPLESAFTMLELQIVVIFAITQCFHFILKQLGIPYLVSQVMTGFLLGPSIPTGPLEKYKKMLFPFGTPDIISTVSSYGYAFLLFLNSVKMDLSLITKTGNKAWVIAISSYFVPIIVGFLSMAVYGKKWQEMLGEDAVGLPVVFISHSGCSFAVISSMLNDLGILNSELGRLALSSAFVNDVLGNIWAGFGTAIVSSLRMKLSRRIINAVAFPAYIILVPLIGRVAMRWVVKNTPEGKLVHKMYVYVIVAMFFLLGYVAMSINQPFLGGAVVLGLAVPEGPPLGSELVHQLELFSTTFLSSIFVTCLTMKVDLTQCDSLPLIGVICGLIIVVHIVRWMLCIGICRYCKMPLNDGFCLALILSCKGVVDLVSYILVYDSMSQSKRVIDIMVVSVLIFGTLGVYGVKTLYDPSRKYAGYQKRNIMNLKHNNELRIVACIHKPCHMNHIKNVLELCYPAHENTLVIDIVHLTELVGRSNPIFIAHKLQQTVGSSVYNYSGELILTFDLFERDYPGFATANTYTAISPVALMHEDVTNLALDKNASLIILPFHVKWGGDGSIESEDTKIQSINSRILERAPCSIGILVNRGPSTLNSISYKVALIFLGGHDDRESLCLAKRFAKNFDNILYVYRLLAHDHDMANWDYMIDDEELRGVRGAHATFENVTYEEIIIKDASQTTFFVKDIANKFDFIICGRRNGVRSSQTSGLENWTEYSELGVIGDLLASPDTETKASILVVQQQSTVASSG